MQSNSRECSDIRKVIKDYHNIMQKIITHHILLHLLLSLVPGTLHAAAPTMHEDTDTNMKSNVVTIGK